MENIIEFNDVAKSYGKKKVLKKMSFKIQMNSCIALVGNNGCGKTTTINLLCNLINYDAGSIYVKNKLVQPKHTLYKKDFGMILSKSYLIEEFNTVEYLAFIGQFQNISKKYLTNRISDVLNLLDIETEKKIPIEKLSSGNRMKVRIAAALIHNPGTLVLDEPFINLDINTQEIFRKVLFQLKGKKTLFITSHNLDLVADLCDTFLIMEQGKIISEIHKSDYTNIEGLKEDIKQKLTIDKRQIDLQWLQ